MSEQQLRRVSSSFNLTKETYQSEEIRTDYQLSDFRHGVRSVEGNVSGELSAGTYADFLASAYLNIHTNRPIFWRVYNAGVFTHRRRHYRH